MLSLTPCLLLEGNCAEAMQSYQCCFGADLTLTRLGNTPMKRQKLGPDKRSSIRTSMLALASRKLARWRFTLLIIRHISETTECSEMI